MKLRVSILTLLCGLGLVGEARAQVVWDSPTLLPPRGTPGTGIYLVDVHRGGLGVLGTFRGATLGTGLRIGVAEGPRGEGIAVLGGLDYMASLARVAPDFPVDISWLTGVGAGYSDHLVISIPLGLAIGRTFTSPEVSFTPYLTPKVIADVHLGRGANDDNDLDLEFDLDLGFDIAFRPGWAVRFGAGLGSRSGIGIGIVF
jgi:hypothetical protein